MTVVVTKNYDEALTILARDGLVCIPDVLSGEQVSSVRTSLEAAVEREEQAGKPVRGMPFDPDENNIRLFALVNKDRCFVELAENELAMRFVHHVLGRSFLLSNFSANITGPGAGRMVLHADQGYVPPPWPDYPLAANIMWLLDDFTLENGATQFVPGSHLQNTRPDPAVKYETVPIEGPAGSIVVMDGRLWHQTGDNVSANSYRAGLFAYYVKPWLRTQWNWYLDIEPWVLKEASPQMLEMLGYGRNPTGALQPLYLKDKG